MRKFLKWSGVALLIPVLLFAVLTLLLYFPPFQNWAIKRVTAYASEKTGMEISIGHINLEFPINLGVEGMKVIQNNDLLPHVKDTVADIEKLVVDVQLLPLFDKKVEIDALEFSRMKINTANFVHEARVKGSVGKLTLQSHGIDLGKQVLKVNHARMTDANVQVELSDTVPPDTSKSENFWKISVDRLQVERSDVTVRTPGDTLQIAAYLGNVSVSDGYFDLYRGEYKIRNLDWHNGALAYDNRWKPRAKGMDYNHLSLGDVNVSLNSLSYCKPKLNFVVKNCSLKEKSGITIKELSGSLALDSARVYLPALILRTPESSLNADFVMDLNVFDKRHPGQLHVKANASFGKQDIVRFLGEMPTDFIKKWPNRQLDFKAVASGNMERLDIAGLQSNLPTAFQIKMNGYVANLDDMKHLKANVTLDAKTHDIGFLTVLAGKGAMGELNIPKDIGVKGNLDVDENCYSARFTATESLGSVKVIAGFDAEKMAYNATLKVQNLNLRHFLPASNLGCFTGDWEVRGTGTDMFAVQTRLKTNAKITKFNFGKYNLSGMHMDADIRNGRIRANVNANNKLMKGMVTLDALMNRRKVMATLAADIDYIDLYSLHLSQELLAIGFCGHFDVATDMNNYYSAQGEALDITLTRNHEVYRPEDISLDILTRIDTTHALINCGDFHLSMCSSGSYKKFLQTGDMLVKEIGSQMKEKRIDQIAIRRKFPTLQLNLHAGNNNFFSHLLAREGYLFNHADVCMNSSPAEGLNGNIQMHGFVADSMRLDTIRVNFVSDSTNITFNGQVRNNAENQQFVFNTLFNGYLFEKGAGIKVSYYDEKDKLGVRLGAEAAMETDGIRLHILSRDAVIAYKEANINEDNYVFFADNSRVSAHLEILAEDGTGLKIFSNDENVEAQQDLTLSLNKLNLEELMSVLPYMPRISGFVNGDYHFVKNGGHISVSSSMSIDKMVYEGSEMGNIGTEFVYMPSQDGSHFVDGTLNVNHEEVGTVTGTYRAENKGFLDAKVNLNRLPISLVNGFIPDQLVGFRGYGEGELDIKGSLKQLQVNGEVFLDSCHLVSVPYGIDLRFSNDPVRIVGSHLLLENFEMYAFNENPLNVAGYISFSDLDNIAMDVRMRARNCEIISSKENPKSVAFGNAFINYYGTMKGRLDNLKMKGNLDVLGTTDLSYILRDSPLTTDNQLNELVKFTDFNDTAQTIVNRPPLTGFNMDLTMDVAKGAHIMAYLNADLSNYIDLMGGGTLRMLYNTTDNFQLRGRYTLDNGEMKYSLPIIPLKTFTIQDGSYIEFAGDPVNPTLNISAIERIKATVSGASGTGRGVYFDCGVVITKTLNDMGLEFTLDAPEDMALHNELKSMSLEQRGKLAVTMLTTGMYLADGNTSGFSMNSALSSFLESEINNITGNALRTLDLSIGLDNSTDASGVMHTDYSFKFAKRFWNNRVKVSVGGKVSTGTDAAYRNEVLFGNVALEYRLDDTANKYVKLYFDNNSYDWLEGYTQQYGIGFVWRRRLQHFKDIFCFKSDKTFVPLEPLDSVQQEKR
ncbi:MAG: translocation/assembly module TamB domain-containing protein [Prevotellaceae bacterium]|nr:translocation/assembly module TamB domain-containing protein [Prevotellaceae bacterium]